MSLITDSDAVAAFCARQKGAQFVTIDTEFMRERTYWPILCVVQVAGPGEAIAIDALAENIDLKPLLALMSDPTTLKVFHGARQDLEIFFQLSGEVPHPIFDTQVAAMVCGFGDAVSYETLVKRLAGASLDKASRFTDWAHRLRPAAASPGRERPGRLVRRGDGRSCRSGDLPQRPASGMAPLSHPRPR